MKPQLQLHRQVQLLCRGHPDRNWILLSDLEGFPFAEEPASDASPAPKNLRDRIWTCLRYVELLEYLCDKFRSLLV